MNNAALTRLRAFTIETVDSQAPGVFLPLPRAGHPEDEQLPRDPNLRLALRSPKLAEPNCGYYEKGTRVYHAAPAIGLPQGWICFESSSGDGSAGMWETLPLLT